MAHVIQVRSAADPSRIQYGLAIEHIASTAVPGLLAKPVIDLMVGREQHYNLGTLRARLVALGYQDWEKPGSLGESTSDGGRRRHLMSRSL